MMKNIDVDLSRMVALGRPGETGITRIEMLNPATFLMLKSDESLSYVQPDGTIYRVVGGALTATADGWEQRAWPADLADRCGK